MDCAVIPDQPRAAQERARNSVFASLPFDGKGIKWVGESSIVGELLAGLPDDARVSVVKSGPHRTVYRLTLPSGTVFLKHFKIADWRGLARNVLRKSPAEREAAAAAHISAAGIDTTVSAAVGVVRPRLVVRDCFLVTHEIAEARPLDQVLRESRSAAHCPQSPGAAGTPTPATRSFRRDLACALGHLAGRLHRHGLTHGDLHPANFLVQTSAQGEIRLSLIDLQRVRRRRRLTFRAVRADLFGFYNSFNGMASRSDRRRFLAAWWLEATAADSRMRGFGRGRAALARKARRLEAVFARDLAREQIENDRKWQRPHRRLIVVDRGWQQARGVSTLGTNALCKFRDDPDALFQIGTLRFWRRRSLNAPRGGDQSLCRRPDGHLRGPREAAAHRLAGLVFQSLCDGDAPSLGDGPRPFAPPHRHGPPPALHQAPQSLLGPRVSRHGGGRRHGDARRLFGTSAPRARSRGARGLD